MSTTPQSSPTSTNAQSPYLGIGLLVSNLGIATLFSGGSSVAYGFGGAAGAILACAILALPLILIWRFATPNGRRQSVQFAFNVFAALILTLWILFYVILKNFVPPLISQLDQKATTSHKSEPYSQHPIAIQELPQSPTDNPTELMSEAFKGNFLTFQIGAPFVETTLITNRRTLDGGATTFLAMYPPPPPGLTRIEIIASSKTLTIGNIYASADFQIETDAKTVAESYANALKKLYGASCQESQSFPNPRRFLLLVCNDKYEIQVAYYPPSELRQSWVVHVGMKSSVDTLYGQSMKQLFTREADNRNVTVQN